MTKPLPFRDLETLSAYLDGQLSSSQARSLENRLKREPDLQRALEDLHRTRQILRSAPRVRAPRNFTLTPEMVRTRAALQRGFKAMRFVAVAASLMFAFLFAGELLLGSQSMSGAALAPAEEPAAELYSMQDMADETGVEAAEKAEAPMALEVGEAEAPVERAVETEADAASDTLPETESVDTPIPKAAEQTSGDDAGGEGLNAQEMTGTPTLMGTPIPPDETAAATEPPPWAPDTAHPQEVMPTDEPAPPDVAAAPPAGHVGAIEEEDRAVETPVILEEPKERLPLIRMAEGGLILIALLSGGLAIYLRRRAG